MHGSSKQLQHVQHSNSFKISQTRSSDMRRVRISLRALNFKLRLGSCDIVGQKMNPTIYETIKQK